MSRKIVINGKFLRAESTGVHRVAEELSVALARLEQEGHPAVERYRFELAVPHDAVQRAAQLRVPQRRIPFLTGIPWEQLTFAFRTRDTVILNLCNIGPVARRRAVTMIHDVQVHLTPESYRPAFRWWYRLVQPIVGKRHALILTVSEFSRREIASVGLAPLDRIAVVPNGADHIVDAVADPQVLSRLSLTPKRYVLGLANTQVHKNIQLLIDAFDDPRMEGLELVLFGSACGEDFAVKGLTPGPRVRFAGRVDDGELRALLENALCLAFPSTTEGFGLPPVEAMRVGCPVIAAPCGALPEVCGDAAIYADPYDIDAWIVAMLDLARSDDLFRKQRESALLQGNRFTWRESALTLVQALKNHGL